MVRIERGEPPQWPDEQQICEACEQLIPAEDLWMHRMIAHGDDD